MAATPRMQAALQRLDEQRVALERQIIAEIEDLYFADTSARPVPRAEDESATRTGSPFTFSWYGIG